MFPSPTNNSITFTKWRVTLQQSQLNWLPSNKRYFLTANLHTHPLPNLQSRCRNGTSNLGTVTLTVSINQRVNSFKCSHYRCVCRTLGFLYLSFVHPGRCFESILYRTKGTFTSSPFQLAIHYHPVFAYCIVELLTLSLSKQDNEDKKRNIRRDKPAWQTNILLALYNQRHW